MSLLLNGYIYGILIGLGISMGNSRISSMRFWRISKFSSESKTLEAVYSDGSRDNLSDGKINEHYAFPGEGYIDHKSLPLLWSFTSLHNHVFLPKAVVELSLPNGSKIPVEVLHKGKEGDQKSIVWKLRNPEDTEKLTNKVVTVHIRKVKINGLPVDYWYSLIPVTAD